MNVRVAQSVFLASILLLPVSAHAQQSTRQDFEEFAALMEGRWIGEIVLSTDVKGIGKSGDKSTGYAEGRICNDGHLLLIDVFHSGAHGNWNIVYNSAEKRIVTMWVMSNGNVDQSTISKRGSTWVESGVGSDAESQKTEFKNELSVADAGNTHHWNLTQTVNGTASKRTETWRRVDDSVEPAQGAEALREFGDLLVGRWVGDVTFIADWPGQVVRLDGKVIAYDEYRWINDGKAIQKTAYVGTDSSCSIIVWNAYAQRIEEFGSWSAGGTALSSIRKTSDRVWSLHLHSATLVGGEPVGGGLVLTFSEDGQKREVTGQITLDAKPLKELRDVYHKVSAVK